MRRSTIPNGILQNTPGAERRETDRSAKRSGCRFSDTIRYPLVIEFFRADADGARLSRYTGTTRDQSSYSHSGTPRHTSESRHPYEIHPLGLLGASVLDVAVVD